MKAETGKPDFMPVVVTFETQEELDKFYAMINNGEIAGALDIHGWWKELEFARSNKGAELFHQKLNELFRKIAKGKT